MISHEKVKWFIKKSNGGAKLLLVLLYEKGGAVPGFWTTISFKFFFNERGLESGNIVCVCVRCSILRFCYFFFNLVFFIILFFYQTNDCLNPARKQRSRSALASAPRWKLDRGSGGLSWPVGGGLTLSFQREKILPRTVKNSLFLIYLFIICYNKNKKSKSNNPMIKIF